ncbi:MAG: carboxylate--amine ligase [Pontixanthobacter sp.]
MRSLPSVALLSVDSPIGLTIMRELGRRRVPVVAIGKNARSLGRHSRYAASFIERPAGPIADWLDPLAQHYGFSRMMAVSEGDLLQLAAIKQSGQSCVQLAVPDADKLRIVLDKEAVNKIAKRVGIAVPQSLSPGSSDPALLERLAYPVAIKWPDPNAILPTLKTAGLDFIKVEYADTPSELEAALSRYDSIGTYPMVQEYCRGYGLGQMFHMQHGCATLRFQHRRLREWPLTGGVSSYCAALPPGSHTDLMAQSEALLQALDWTGPAMVEYKYDAATGRAMLMEINGRFWGSQPLASVCGAEFGWETYRRAFLKKGYPNITEPVFNSWKLNRARYAAPELKNLRDVMISSRPIGEKVKFIVRFCADFLDPRAYYYVWSWRDPKPFLHEVRNSLGRKLHKDI